MAFEQPEPGTAVYYEVEKVGVVSLAKLFAALYGVLASIIGVLYGLGIAVASLVGVAQGQNEALLGLVLAVAFAIGIPLLYGVMGGIAGGLMALIYNLAASRLGGIQVTLRTRELAPM